ncbi:MAG: recombinase family protein [Planctomycetota bacterium]
MTFNCAIYTRKSTEEGLEQDFNSLDAQREACEAYVLSQKNEGWFALPTRYDDGGYSGGNVERPAFRRLMEHIESGLVQVLVIYKIDRLTRSLGDFARVMEALEKHRVTLVSVTQNFNTTTSMGRLTLNMLLSFAQFEREMTAERTRDKIGAMRCKGKHFGGHQVLGYNVVREPSGAKLMVNETEAQRVLEIFKLYLQYRAMVPVVKELDRRGWRNKAWATKAGKPRGGGPIDKSILWRILTNPIYLGKVKYRERLYEGEHEAIVPQELWAEVQAMLARNHRGGGNSGRSSKGDSALLRGLLICEACGAGMIPTYTSKRLAGGAVRRYRYYVCGRAAKRGRQTCSCPSLAASEIESFVAQEVAVIGSDGKLRQRVVAKARDQLAEAGRWLDEESANQALIDFEPIWKTLPPGERQQLIHLLVSRVAYDHQNERIAITFHPSGLASLSEARNDVGELVSTK